MTDCLAFTPCRQGAGQCNSVQPYRRSAWLYNPLPDNLPDVWHATKAEIEAHNAARVAETGDIYRNE